MKADTSALTSLQRAGEQPQSTRVNGSSRRLQTSRLRIVVVDDHPITLAGLDALLSGERDFTVVARCADGYAAVRSVSLHQPDVLIVDLDMPGMDGLAILKYLRTSGNHTPVILLATANNQKVTEALSLGAQGVVLKQSDPHQLIRCLREVRAGHRWLDESLDGHSKGPAIARVLDSLTRRQVEVAWAAVSGLSNKELAQRFGVSEGTIKNHLHAIYERLGLDGRLALLLYLKEKALA
jgi:DNA-binding NarL/FixJ family response regulator